MADLEVGQVAPSFSALTQNGDTVTLESMRGKIVVLYFYPKDDTPGCTREACGFRDLRAELEAENAVVFGVSRDSVDSHQQFASKYELTFPLLADSDETICNAYGVIKEKTQYGKTSIGLVRTTFIIDQEGKIAKIYPNVRVDGHVEKVVEAVKQLNA